VDEELKAKEERRKTKEMLAQETQGLEVKRLGKMKYQEGSFPLSYFFFFLFLFSSVFAPHKWA
jgi:hypothetical protein